MPRITAKTNVFLNREKKYRMTLEFKEAIELIPCEKGSFVMADFEDEAFMLFGDLKTTGWCFLNPDINSQAGRFIFFYIHIFCNPLFNHFLLHLFRQPRQSECGRFFYLPFLKCKSERKDCFKIWFYDCPRRFCFRKSVVSVKYFKKRCPYYSKCL